MTSGRGRARSGLAALVERARVVTARLPEDPASVAAVATVVREIDLDELVGGVAEVLGVDATRISGVAILGRNEWWARNLVEAARTFRPLAELWGSDDDVPTEGVQFRDLFGILVGPPVADLAAWQLGDFDVALPRSDSDDFVALAGANMAALADDWQLSLEAAVGWGVTSAIAHRLLMTPAAMGGMSGRCALRYRSSLAASIRGEMGTAFIESVGSGHFDFDALLRLRTRGQQRCARELAAISALCGALEFAAWRRLRPADAGIEARLVELLRHRGCEELRPRAAAEFWLAAPIGTVHDDGARELAEQIVTRPGGVAAVRAVLPRLLRELPVGRRAAESPIPGRPRVVDVSALGTPTAGIAPRAFDLGPLRDRLDRAFAASPDEGVRDVLAGRIAGLSSPPGEVRLSDMPAGSPQYRLGVATTSLQVALVQAGAPLDTALERASVRYVSVIMALCNERLRTGDSEADFVRLHTRAMIQLEKAGVAVSDDVERSMWRWVTASSGVASTPAGRALWNRTRDWRLRLGESDAGEP